MWAKTLKRTFHKWIVAPAIALFLALASVGFAQTDKCSPDTLWPMANGMGYYLYTDTAYYSVGDTSAWTGIYDAAGCYTSYSDSNTIVSMGGGNTILEEWSLNIASTPDDYTISRAFVVFNTRGMIQPYAAKLELHQTSSFEDVVCSQYASTFRPKSGNPCAVYQVSVTDSHNFYGAFSTAPLAQMDLNWVSLPDGWGKATLPISFISVKDTTCFGFVLQPSEANEGDTAPTGINTITIDSIRLIYWYHGQTPFGERGRWDDSRRWDSGSWSDD